MTEGKWSASSSHGLGKTTGNFWLEEPEDCRGDGLTEGRALGAEDGAREEEGQGGQESWALGEGGTGRRSSGSRAGRRAGIRRRAEPPRTARTVGFHQIQSSHIVCMLEKKTGP